METTIRENNKYRRIKHAGYTQPVADRYGLLTMQPGEVKSLREMPVSVEYRRWAIVNAAFYYRKTGRLTRRFWTRAKQKPHEMKVTIEYGIKEDLAMASDI